MKKTKYYYKTKFPGKVIEQAHDLFLSKLGPSKGIDGLYPLRIGYGDEQWEYDSRQEFLAEYPKAEDYAFSHQSVGKGLRIYSDPELDCVRVEVEFPDRTDIESIFRIFETRLDESKIRVEAEPIKIFIGHDDQWRDLKDHLHEQHGFEVVAYEIGPRAGLSVKEVLGSMLTETSIAFLVMTGEDIDTEGEVHARENVVHELGLFQGHVGFGRAIALVEKGVKEFSNILGVNQIRFSKGNIRETFGDVLAVIKREFTKEDA